jgi:hypothetical protein
MDIQKQGHVLPLDNIGPGKCVEFDGLFFITTGNAVRKSGIFAVSLNDSGDSLRGKETPVRIIENAQVVVT